MRRVVAALVSMAVAGGAAAVASPPATAKSKYTACVKKSSGEMRVLLGKKKKCKKGWKKTTWRKGGPTGEPGAPGAPGATGTSGPVGSLGTVYDGNGAEVGQSLNTSALGITQFIVRIDGGVFVYYSNGWLSPYDATYFSNAACTGQVFTRATSPDQRDYLLASTGYRSVYRQTSPSLGPAAAYSLSGTYQSVINAQHYTLSSSGACQAQPLFTGYAMPMTSVPAPPDRPGPLTVR